MTLFWLAAALLTAAVVALLVSPLLRPPKPQPGREACDLEVYRDQLAEIDRDLERCVIGAGQAEAARGEIGRRILATAAAADPDADSDAAPTAAVSPPAPARSNRRLALGLLVAIPAVALALYLAIGRPDLPAQPLAGRQSPTGADQSHGDVGKAVARLAERLKQDPTDFEGWTLLAESLGKLDRRPEAVDAWRQALALARDDPDVQGSLAEALVDANQTLVSEEARRLFAAVLSQKPDDPRARYFLALALAQGGDFRGALDRWSALVASSPADAPWLPTVTQAITDMAQRLKLDPATVMPKPLPPQGQAGPPTDADRTAQVRAMVRDLAARLAAAPEDVTGWLRLARACQVLGDGKQRLDALVHAKAQAPNRPDVLVAYAEALLEQAPAGGAGTDTRLPAEAAEAFRSALKLAPDTPEALWYLGLDAAAGGHPAEARALWQKLLSQLDPASSDYTELKTRLEALK